MSFVFKKSRNANGGRELVECVLGDSTLFSVGMAVKYDSGTLVVWTGGAGAGIITAIRKADGSPITDDGLGDDFEGSYTTPASNTVVAVIDVSTDSIYSCAADAALGTTNDSDDQGINLDAATGSITLDESTAEVAGTTAAFNSHGEDTSEGAPDNSLLVSIQESQVKI